MRALALGALMLAAAAPALAADQGAADAGATEKVAEKKGAGADARFDRTGDGLVDAADWGRLTPKERRAYARACLQELGLDPDAGVGEGKTRADRYLEGLESVYGR